MIEQVKILKATGLQLSLLEKEINLMIKDGWQPSGQMVNIKVDKTDLIIQQMTLTIKE